MRGRIVESRLLRISIKRLARRQAAMLSLAGGALLIATAAALAWTGGLTQPAGAAGCISQDGSGPCADGHGLWGPSSVAVSPDGKNVYVATASSVSVGAVARLDRNRTTGALTQPAGAAGCISQDGSGTCADGHGLIGGGSLAVSPDGKSVYVAFPVRGIVVRLNRNTTTGALTQPAGAAGCVSRDGLGGKCASGHGLRRAFSVGVSPDGRNVYVASEGRLGAGKRGGIVARLNRNPTTGAITQPAGTAGCVSEYGTGGTCADGHGLQGPVSVAVSPDGKSVYAASRDSSAVARLDRNPTTGALTQPAGPAGCLGLGPPCAKGHALDGPVSVAVSPDGKSVYAASSASFAVARLVRNTTTGAITQPAASAGCVSEFGMAGYCADGHALSSPQSVAVSPDGKSVYAASQGYAPQGYPPSGHGVARLTRDPTTGAITQPAGTAGCVSEDGSGPCADGHALNSPYSVAVSPDGKSVYVASIGSSAVVRFKRAP